MDITVNLSGNNTKTFEINHGLMKKHINLNAAEPERLRDICSLQDYLMNNTTTYMFPRLKQQLRRPGDWS